MLSAQPFSFPVTDVRKQWCWLCLHRYRLAAQIRYLNYNAGNTFVSCFPSPPPSIKVMIRRKHSFMRATVFSSFHKSVCYIWRAYSCIPIQFIFIEAMCLLQISSKCAAEIWAPSRFHVFSQVLTLCYDTNSLFLNIMAKMGLLTFSSVQGSDEKSWDHNQKCQCELF